MKHYEIRCELRVSLWAISRVVLLDGNFFFLKYSLLGGGGGFFFCFECLLLWYFWYLIIQVSRDVILD